MKNLVITIVGGFVIFLTMSSEKMSDDGKAGYTNSPGELNCTDCHATNALNSGGGSVSLISTNMPGWVYDPGVTYHMEATISRPTDSLFGICVEALLPNNSNAGTLVITNAVKTQIKTKTVTGVSRRSMVHKLDAGQGTGSYTFTFDWIAPASNLGVVTFYFAGNAADGDGTEDGDYIYTGSRSCPYNLNNNISSYNSENSISVFPIPVIEQFTVNYNLNSSGSVHIKLYSMRGELVSKLASKVMIAGHHSENSRGRTR